ncbi:MAG: hypothetical protein ABIA59_03415 [Candidatus Latescibacterota bacterium]
MKSAIILVMFSLLMMPLICPAQKAAELDPVMRRELIKLEETWYVLDTVAGKVWPGWDSYGGIPYMFTFENNVKLLVGHPNPPPDFRLVPGILAAGKTVYIDRENEVPVTLTSPTNYSGGLSDLGTYNNKTVEIISISVRSMPLPTDGTPANKRFDYASENDILLNVHELFHAFQRTFYDFTLGNLQYTPDANYAIYSEIEGRALKRAFREVSDDAAREYLKDFAVARKLKYRSMATIEQNQEKEDDVNEGTARYSEYATLQLLSQGFRPAADEKALPYYFGFQNIDYYFGKRMEMLDYYITATFQSKMKCYDYGCFQALLLDRFVPGWKKSLGKDSPYMYDLISRYLALDKAEESRIAAGLEKRYNFAGITAHQGGAIEERDRAFDTFDAQQGRVYIISFKNIFEFPVSDPKAGSESFTMGLRWLYPSGVEPLQIQEVSLVSSGRPILQDRIYYMRYVDTEDEDYEIEFSEVEGDVYHDAVVSTNGFTLKAPRIRVKERGERVKFIILAKVSEQ